MYQKSLMLLMLVLLVSPLISVPAFSEQLTVNTDEDVYHLSEFVTIYGSANPIDKINILVNIYSFTVLNTTTIATEDGIYTVTFQLANDATTGEYAIFITCAEEFVKTEFYVEHGTYGLYNNLISLLETSHTQAETILDRLEAKGVDIPERSEEKLELGEEAAEEAIRLREEGEYPSVAGKATEALQLYGEAIQIALQVDPEKITQDGIEEQAEKAVGLRVAIERAYSFLEKVNNTATQLIQKGFDISNVKKLLKETKVHLQIAETMLDEGDIEGAEDEKSRTQRIIDQALKLIHGAYEEDRIEKAGLFLERTEERLHSLEERIIRLDDGLQLSPTTINGISEVFQNAQLKIQDIRGIIAADGLDIAIDELDGISKDVYNGLRLLEKFNSDKTDILKDMEIIEGIIFNLEDEFDELGAGGIDISDAETKLDETKNILNEALSSLENNELETAENLLAQAKDIIEYASDMTRMRENEQLNQTKDSVEEAGEITEDMEKSQSHENGSSSLEDPDTS